MCTSYLFTKVYIFVCVFTSVLYVNATTQAGAFESIINAGVV